MHLLQHVDYMWCYVHAASKTETSGGVTYIYLGHPMTTCSLDHSNHNLQPPSMKKIHTDSFAKQMSRIKFASHCFSLSLSLSQTHTHTHTLIHTHTHQFSPHAHTLNCLYLHKHENIMSTVVSATIQTLPHKPTHTYKINTASYSCIQTVHNPLQIWCVLKQNKTKTRGECVKKKGGGGRRLLCTIVQL